MILSNVATFYWTDGITRYNTISEAQEPWHITSLVKNREGHKPSRATIVDWNIDPMFRDESGDGVGIVPERFVKELKASKRVALGAVKAKAAKERQID